MAGKSKIGDLTGQRFGLWVVVQQAPNSQQRGRRWLCLCDCGTKREIAQASLRSGRSLSCGCYSNERHSLLMARRNSTHGLSKTPEYKIWKDIVRRCENEGRPEYKNYGGRGIRICEAWRTSFEAFFAYVGKRPSRDLSVDRIDNDGNYEPGNVRWATKKTQRRNSRQLHMLTSSGVTLPMYAWAELNGIPRARIKQRLKYGLSEEEAVSPHDFRMARQ